VIVMVVTCATVWSFETVGTGIQEYSRHRYVCMYCDEMPESGIEESFPRQRTESFPL
jgi:hypothetical protein